MKTDLRPYLYTKELDPHLDEQFSHASKFGKVRLAADYLFWRTGFRWYGISLKEVQRIHRRIHSVVGRLCAGGRNYDVEYLVLILSNGEELVVHIADDAKNTALELVAALRKAHPELKFGKE